LPQVFIAQNMKSFLSFIALLCAVEAAKIAVFLSPSIASGTPLITVPLFGDQFRNSRLAEYRGFGVRVDKTSMDFETLNGALHTILKNPRYHQ
ncbi:hypothetical protein PENTCL1PPCAC_30195, partial [Pristionchus entomophagus]